MKRQLGMPPSVLGKHNAKGSPQIQIRLYYCPPFNWEHTFLFLKNRTISKLEWIDNDVYGRTFEQNGVSGYFSVQHLAKTHCLLLTLQIDDDRAINSVVQRVRENFDLNAPSLEIDKYLKGILDEKLRYQEGLRIPGIWGHYEAGIRAILGQQVSIKQARSLVTLFVNRLGADLEVAGRGKMKLFPRPENVVIEDLSFLKMPASRKETVRLFSRHFVDHPRPLDVDEWKQIKGIGPWTVNYSKIRADKHPDIYLQGDAGIKNALALCSEDLDEKACSPWRSYLTFQLWNQLQSK